MKFFILALPFYVWLELFFNFQDKNLGLVKQVVSSMYKRNIQRLTQTYLTLSLQDIANTVQLNSPKEAEMHVLQMVSLSLFDNPLKLSSNLMLLFNRFKKVTFMLQSTRRMEWSDSSRTLNNTKPVRWLNALTSQSRGVYLFANSVARK